MGFGVNKDGNFHDQLEGDEQEDSDDQGYEMRKYSTINSSFDISGIHFSKNNCQYAFLILSGKMCFTIYYVYEEQMEGCEFDEVWTMNYRFNPTFNIYGQHTCFDFNSTCTEFVSGSNSGYICRWLRNQKSNEQAVRINDVRTSKPMFIDQIAWMHKNTDDMYVTFSTQSQTL